MALSGFMKMSPDRSKRMKYLRKIYDIFLYSTALIGLVISFSGIISPRNTYIQCNDPYISYDYHKDTISISLLLVVSLIVPLLTMMIFEWMNLHKVPTASPFSTGIKRAYNFFLSLLVGDLFSFFVVEVLKTSVSEPRPSFMNSCSPNLTEEMCEKHWIHVTWENCTNPLGLSDRKLMDTMKSFPSGHASIGVFSAVFMTIYVQKRVRVSWSTLLVAWLQLVWWTWAFLCCASRIWDNKHHWWDVLFGGILGAVAGYATVVYLCHSFEEAQTSETLNEDKIAKEHRIDFSTDNNSSKDLNGHYCKPIVELEESTSSNATTSEPIQRLLVE